MKTPLLLAALAVLGTYAQSQKGSYVIVAPSKVRHGMDFPISVNLLKGTGTVTVTARLLVGVNEASTATAYFTPGVPGTLNLPAPSVPSHSYKLEVTGKGGLTFKDTQDVQTVSKKLSMHIQTDKGIYKPGDVVNFRVLAVNPNLKFYTGTMTINIYDGSSNKIKQFTDVTPTKGVFSGKLVISSQPVLGDWKIQVQALQGDAQEEKTFAVAEYVLPKFEVDIDLPSFVVTTDTDVKVTVRATYTYGQPVKGTAQVLVQFIEYWREYDLSNAKRVLSTQVNVDGTGVVYVPLSAIQGVYSGSLNQHKLIVTANVTESLTGNSMNGEAQVTMYNKRSKLEFPDTNPDTFKPGLQYTAYLQVSEQDGVPVTVGTVTVSVRISYELPEKDVHPTPFYYWGPRTESKTLPDFTLPIPANGLVAIPVDIWDNATDVTITAQYDGISTSLSLGKTHSPSDSAIQLSLLTSGAIEAGDTISFKAKATQPFTTLIYSILSRGGLVKTGATIASNTDEHTFTVVTDPSMSPNARIVVYFVRADGEIVTDSISFNVGGAFKNKVAISINTTETLPGKNVDVTVKAEPLSTAYLLAIDQSVLLLRSGNDISQQDVYEDLEDFDTITSSSSSPGIGFGGGAFCPNCRRRKRSIWWPFPRYFGGNDAKTIFENAGVVVLTDATVYDHPDQPQYVMDDVDAFVFNEAVADAGVSDVQESASSRARGASDSDTPSNARPKIRSDFSETFLYASQSIGSNGESKITTAVPDTITSWVASAFAYHPTAGLGVAPGPANLRVFKPFFVSLNLPYSVTRGEELALQAIVFNYLDSDLTVDVTLDASTDFSIVTEVNGYETYNQRAETKQIFVPKNESRSVYFPIKPTSLGRIDLEVTASSPISGDRLKRQLLVEAEGTPKEYSIPVLIDLTDSTVNSFTKTIDLTLPPNFVQGSEFFRITAIGDLMGPSISNLDKLLKMPTGCGEQNMIGLAPDVYITDYLAAVGQLTSQIKEKALGFMESGYQRELKYKHEDHSFSAFGENDSSGSMWLTAFVSRVFHQASTHITVDSAVLQNAIRWMLSKQNADGSFPEPGRVIHKNMQGQAGQGIGLTTFVFISLLENEDLLNSMTGLPAGAKDKAQAYIESQISQTDDVYLLAMASYALQLAGSTQAQAVLNKLEQHAITSGGLKHWEKPADPVWTTKPESWHPPNPTNPINTEMTAYALLTYAAKRDIVGGRPIMNWISQQRNGDGGFSSTQDTVVALQALAEYAKLTFSNNFEVTARADLDCTDVYDFTINNGNALILQTREKTSIPAQVVITANGTGLALMQVTVYFNVNEDVEDETFDLTVNFVEEKLNYLILRVCSKWLGGGEKSAMAIYEVGVPSGFTPDLDSITSLPILKRIDTANKKVILYLDEIGKTTPVCVDLKTERTGFVAKSQPVPVKVYDYYEPEKQKTVLYESKILKDTKVCAISNEICP